MSEQLDARAAAHKEKLRQHLDSLGQTAIGDLNDDEVKKLQLRLDVLDKWARLNRSALTPDYPGTDDHDHDDTDHVHHVE